jgi:DGQHR domain-containing protein
MPNETTLCLPAVAITQGPGRTIYSFAVDGKLIREFAAVSRIGRGKGSEIRGYQRPEVLSHIAEIRGYLESDSPLIPNAIVIAFNRSVTFVPAADQVESGAYSQTGTIEISYDPKDDEGDKPGWIVDGQQRVAAIREAQIDAFPICVCAFIAEDDQEQREQFILVNSVKPLPKGLIYELLPSTEARLSSALQRRRFPALLLSRLNYDEDSPLNGMIRTPTVSEGLIKDNSILRMIENSLTDGALYQHRNANTGDGDVDAMLGILKPFWSATRDVFGDAWGLPPRRSRLMHGAGIVSLGFVMDAIVDRNREKTAIPDDVFAEDLRAIAPACRWTDGYWDFGPGAQRKWNELQNTGKDIQLLSNFLLTQYKSRVWNRAGAVG